MCPRPGCTRGIPTDIFSCRAHWYQLPPGLRLRVGAAYRNLRKGKGDMLDALRDMMAVKAEAIVVWTATEAVQGQP